MLRYLTREKINLLGIINDIHVNEILMEIGYLYPVRSLSIHEYVEIYPDDYVSSPSTGSRSPSDLSMSSRRSSISSCPGTPMSTNSSETSSGSVRQNSPATPMSSNSSETSSGSVRQNSPAQYERSISGRSSDSRRLIVTPICESETVCCLRESFQRHGIITEDIEEVGSNAFLVTFLDSHMARQVYAEMDKYELRTVRVKFAARPSPTMHVKYEVLFDTMLFDGKSAKAGCKGILKKGTVVIANQLKKRRVRLVDGDTNYGWASLFGRNNEMCLRPIEE